MLATFKETVTSFRDANYGRTIITKPLRSVLWYWTKYLLVIAVIPLVFAIIVLTRFLPESPKLVKQYLPEGVLGAKDNLLFSTIPQPFSLGGADFRFILDLDASPSAIESVPDGILVLKDRIITKSSDVRYQIQTFENLPDFSFDKYQIADWITNHRFQIWLIGLLLIFIVGLVVFCLTWSARVVSYLVLTILIWLLAKVIMKKQITYLQTLNLVIYASVLPLLLSAILFIMPNQFLSFLNFGLLIIFAVLWIKNLPAASRA